MVNGGAKGDGFSVQYTPAGDYCWHHAAVVLAPVSQTAGTSVHLYIDGNEVAPTNSITNQLDTSNTLHSSLFGEGFRIGDFQSTDGMTFGSQMRVSEVRLWSRALSQSEITLLSRASGSGRRCEIPLLTSYPSILQRCVYPAQMPTPSLEMDVRVLDKRNLVVVADPNPWIKSRIKTDCSVFLDGVSLHKRT